MCVQISEAQSSRSLFIQAVSRSAINPASDFTIESGSTSKAFLRTAACASFDPFGRTRKRQPCAFVSNLDRFAVNGKIENLKEMLAKVGGF